MITNKKFGEYLYHRLPEIYRTADEEKGIDLTLKRYLDSLACGGFDTLYSDALTLEDILSADKTPDNVLPYLGRLLGYEYMFDVDIDIQRKVISNLTSLYKIKGTTAVIEFITREFTKYDTAVIQTEYRIFRTWSPNPKGIPTSEYLEPRTLNAIKVNADTFHLISSHGKYNGSNIIVVLDSNERGLVLINRLLVRFLPVWVKLYLSVNDNFIEAFEDTATVRGADVDSGLTFIESENRVLVVDNNPTQSRTTIKAQIENLITQESSKASINYTENESTVTINTSNSPLSVSQLTTEPNVLVSSEGNKLISRDIATDYLLDLAESEEVTTIT